ncbi:MAG TPA: hypothetical protein VIM70_21100 [Clostridium sp.]|uniref:hypothetical protein n=1 Tax=Clostridium sp. TaxID=1506 RepID=UPI002F940D7B
MAVDFSLSNSFFIHKSKKYEDIYDVVVNKKHIFKMSELFTLCASLGFKHSNFVQFASKGTEMRSEHFKENNLTALYSIMINSPLIKADLDNFSDYDFLKNSFKTLEKYAEGGMDILCKKVFEKNWDGNKLDADYEYYDVDLLRFIYEDYKEGSF